MSNESAGLLELKKRKNATWKAKYLKKTYNKLENYRCVKDLYGN